MKLVLIFLCIVLTASATSHLDMVKFLTENLPRHVDVAKRKFNEIRTQLYREDMNKILNDTLKLEKENNLCGTSEYTNATIALANRKKVVSQCVTLIELSARNKFDQLTKSIDVLISFGNSALQKYNDCVEQGDKAVGPRSCLAILAQDVAQYTEDTMAILNTNYDNELTFQYKTCSSKGSKDLIEAFNKSYDRIVKECKARGRI